MGITGMQSAAFDTFMQDLCESQGVALRVCYENAFCLSADVTAAYDPNFAEVYEKRNAAYINGGVGICKYTGARGKSGSSDANAETVGYVRQVLEKIQAEYASRLSIEDCAESMQVSASYLSRKLKEITCHTFGELLARYRLQEALKLLEDGRYKVYEVAEHTGFGEYKNFCQVFKKYLQVSPKRYMQERELKLSK